MKLSILFTRYLLIASDRICYKIFLSLFHKIKISSLLEIGVNTPILIQKLRVKYDDEALFYMGFEANPSNYGEHNMQNFGIINSAVSLSEAPNLEFFVPILNRPHTDNLFSSGKGSLISNRHGSDEIKVTVPNISAKEIVESEDFQSFWIDAEGISLDLFEFFANHQKSPINLAHIEIEMRDLFRMRSFLETLPTTMDYILSRTSHDQYNLMIYPREYLNPLLLCSKAILKFLDFTFSATYSIFSFLVIIKKAIRSKH